MTNPATAMREAVARALFNNDECYRARDWVRVSQLLRDTFLSDADAAIRELAPHLDAIRAQARREGFDAGYMLSFIDHDCEACGLTFNNLLLGEAYRRALADTPPGDAK